MKNLSYLNVEVCMGTGIAQLTTKICFPVVATYNPHAPQMRKERSAPRLKASTKPGAVSPIWSLQSRCSSSFLSEWTSEKPSK